MRNQLKISIIIPVYNAEKHLSQCLESLLDQGVPHEQYEIICVNDGSKDASSSIIKEYAEKFSNIIAIDKENEGVSAARNKGIDVARGKYVWFIDADDWMATGFLEHGGIGKLCDDQTINVPLILTSCIELRDEESKQYYGYSVSDGDVLTEDARPFMTTARGHFFDRNMIEKNNLRFDTNLSYGEDLMFMREFLDIIRFENESGSNHRILQCKGKGAYIYRLHNESAMGQLRGRMAKVAESILYRARISAKRYRMKDKPDWYRANYQEYLNLHMQEYMIYYFPGLSKPMLSHLKELKKEGLYPSPPPKLGWEKQASLVRKVQQFAFKHSLVYPLYYILMRMKFKKSGII